MTKTWQECLRAGLKGLYFPVAAILAAVVLSSIVMAILGFDPLYAYQCLLKGAFGNTNSIGETLVKTTPLIFAAVAFALPMRCGIFNLGATGQLYIGAICAAPSILGHIGLLDGANMTCYPGFESQMPDAVYTGAAVERYGNIITSKGPGTAIEFALKLAELLAGEEKAAAVRASLQMA